MSLLSMGGVNCYAQSTGMLTDEQIKEIFYFVDSYKKYGRITPGYLSKNTFNYTKDLPWISKYGQDTIPMNEIEEWSKNLSFSVQKYRNAISGNENDEMAFFFDGTYVAGRTNYGGTGLFETEEDKDKAFKNGIISFGQELSHWGGVEIECISHLIDKHGQSVTFYPLGNSKIEPCDDDRYMRMSCTLQAMDARTGEPLKFLNEEVISGYIEMKIKPARQYAHITIPLPPVDTTTVWSMNDIPFRFLKYNKGDVFIGFDPKYHEEVEQWNYLCQKDKIMKEASRYAKIGGKADHVFYQYEHPAISLGEWMKLNVDLSKLGINETMIRAALEEEDTQPLPLTKEDLDIYYSSRKLTETNYGNLYAFLYQTYTDADAITFYAPIRAKEDDSIAIVRFYMDGRKPEKVR